MNDRTSSAVVCTQYIFLVQTNWGNIQIALNSNENLWKLWMKSSKCLRARTFSFGILPKIAFFLKLLAQNNVIMHHLQYSVCVCMTHTRCKHQSKLRKKWFSQYHLFIRVRAFAFTIRSRSMHVGILVATNSIATNNLVFIQCSV